MAEELLNRIDSVANFLEAVKGQDCYDKAWVMQEAQLETCIKGAGLDVRHAGQIAMALKRLPKPERLTQVLSEAMMSTPVSSSSSHRRELQNFCVAYTITLQKNSGTLCLAAMSLRAVSWNAFCVTPQNLASRAQQSPRFKHCVLCIC